jgi:hypothetical protein
MTKAPKKPVGTRARKWAKETARMFGPGRGNSDTNKNMGQPVIVYDRKTGKIDHKKSMDLRYPAEGSAAAVKKARALAKKTQRPLPKKKLKKK